VLFHIFHATFVLDFWSIWVGPKDIPEFKAEMMRDLGKDVPGSPKPGKYPLGNRLYHLAVMVAGLFVIGTGILMMWRVRTGLGVTQQAVSKLPSACWHCATASCRRAST